MDSGPFSRRSILQSVVYCSGIALLGRKATQRGAASGSGWQHFRHDAGNTGYAPEHSGPKRGLVKREEISVSSDSEHGNATSPTIRNGIIYVGIGDQILAVDKDDFSIIWRVSKGAAIGACPIINDSVICATANGDVYSLDASDGSEEWHREISGLPSGPPTVTEEEVFVVTFDRNVYSLSTASGAENWNFEFGSPGIAPVGPPAVDDEFLYFATRGIVTAISREGNRFADVGNQRNLGPDSWQTPLEGSVIDGVTVIDGTVYVATSETYSEEGKFHVLSADDGTILGKYDYSNTDPPLPEIPDDMILKKRMQAGEFDMIIAGGALYAAVGNSLRVIDTATGEQTGYFKRGINGPPAVLDGNIYIGSGNSLIAVEGGAKAVIGEPFGEDSTALNWNEQLTLSGENSRTSAESITSYEWTITGTEEFTNRSFPETKASGSTLTRTFWFDGTYEVQLQVTDSEGRSDVTTYEVWVYYGPLFWALIGGVLSTPIGIYAIRKPTDATEEDSDSMDTPEKLITEAEATLEEANTSFAKGHYSNAADEYETVRRQYQNVLSQLDDDDERYKEIENKLDNVEEQLAQSRQYGETLSEFSDALQTGETHFQTAIAAPTSEKIVIPRAQYRQARNAFENALELAADAEFNILDNEIQITPSPTVEAPPESLSQLPEMTHTIETFLDDWDIETVTDLQNGDDEFFSELRSQNAISPKMKIWLQALSNWHGDDTIEFADREGIEERYEIATKAYHQYKSN